MALQKHHRKSGPGRMHEQGEPGLKKNRGRGFKGASFSIARPLSDLHPTVIAKRRSEHNDE